MRLSALACLAALFAIPVHASDWSLAKDEDGIKVFLKEVPGSTFKAFRGETTINADAAVIKRLQEDVEGSCEWLHACESQRLLKQEGNEAWSYTRIDTPWPAKPRDSIVHVTNEPLAGGGFKRTLQGAPTYLPEESGYVRVSELDGYWRVEPVSEGKVKVTYEVHTEPGGEVPAWIVNKFVVDAPFNTLSGLRELAESKAGR